MQRFGRLLMLVASPFWACAVAWPCRAQSPPAGAPQSGGLIDGAQFRCISEPRTKRTRGVSGCLATAPLTPGVPFVRGSDSCLHADLGQPTESPPAAVQDESLPAPRLASPGEVPVSSLKPAPLESTDLPLPINLAAALRLADARPLLVAAAQASAWVAEAQLSRAKVIWVPTLNFGAAYVRHDGFGPDFNRGLNTPERPMNQNVNWLYAGFGIIQSAYGPANIITDSNSAPVAMRRPPNMTADMIFQPLAARQVLDARKWDIQTAKNDVLLQTAAAYFSVHEYRGKYAGALDSVAKGRDAVKRIDDMSKDLVPRAEVDRARRMLAELEQKAASAREAWRVSSADLTEILRLDPRVVVVPLEHDHLQITLIEPSRPVHELTLIALLSRPELASQQSLVRAAEQRIRREKWRPWLPNFFLNGFESPGMRIQAGALGTGQGTAMNLWSWRNDITPSIEWQVDGFGAGNLARVKEKRGEQSREIEKLLAIQDAVAADVTRSQAHLQSAAVRAVQAERELREAVITFEKNLQGLGQTQRFDNLLHLVYRPQEVVAALEHLQKAYDKYFGSVADYNRAQFELFHALGYPADEIAYLNSAGEPAPVNTERPEFLPPVGIGPPPATR